MELKNAKVNFLGDSITYGCGASTLDNGYVSVLAREQGLAQARNYGISGTRFARQTSVSENPDWDLDFCSRVSRMDPDADAVVVFGGTNDYGHGDAPIGSPTDTTPSSFWGACHTLMRSLIERYPGKPIVILTPLHRLDEDVPNPKSGTTLSEYVQIIKTVAAHYSLPVLDLWAMSGIQPCVPIVQERFMPDGLHPSDAGHALLAARIGNFLRAL